MAIKFDTFTQSGGGAGSDTLDDVTTRGASTTNAITVGSLSVGSAYTMPTSDGTANQVLSTSGTGTISFTTLNITGGLEYKGAFNATAGTPSIASAQQGDFYIIGTAGTIYGQTWAVGDHLLINADMGGSVTNSKIDKIDNTDAVTSVNGQVGTVSLAVNNLSDVTITAATSGEVLKYNGSAWVDASVAYSEVTGTPTDISAFTNDSGYLTTITGESINDLSDVTITSATSGQVISYNGSAWVNSATSAGSLAGLSDVTLTAPADSEYLRYNGSAWVDASLGIVDDTTPSLGGDLDTNGNAITSASNADVFINPDGTGEISIGADVVPDVDVTHTIGSEDYRYISTYSDLNGAIRFKAKNNQGSTLTKGQVVFISGVSGTVPEVQLARANSASTMPAFGLVQANANDQAEVQIITFGNLTDYDTTTHSLSANDTVYVSSATAGALTNAAPTGETNLIQNIGRVVRADASAGIIKVGGAGRSNATPNLDSNKMFLGNGSNQAVSTALSSVALSSFNNDLTIPTAINDLSDVTITSATSGQVISYNGSAWVNSAASSGSLAGLSDVTITAATSGEVLKYNGSAWVDASVAYSEVTGTPTDISAFTNDSGYLTTITGESINDLSDVTITAAASGEYLRYNGSAWVDASLGIVDDTTPSLGGNLDVSSNDIVSTSDGAINLAPDGSGQVTIKGNATGGSGQIKLNCEDNTHGITLKGPPHSAAASYTLTLPDTDGTADQVLKTDGTGGLDWVDQASGGGGFTYSAITADPANALANYHYSCTGTFTITLATSGISAGSEIRIKNMGTGDITIDPQTQTIDGVTTDYVLDVQYSAITLVSTGSNWEII